MLVYLILYLAVVTAIVASGVVGVASSLVLLAGAAYWLIVFFGTNSKNKQKWARSVFGASLVLSLLLLVAALFNIFVPPIT
jgi:heme O synthase-like polyprenyltransferase